VAAFVKNLIKKHSLAQRIEINESQRQIQKVRNIGTKEEPELS